MDYTLNVNPFGAPKSLKQFINKNYYNITADLKSEYEKAKNILAEYHSLKSENITIGSGCTELIYLAIQTLRPRKALIPMPTLTLYSEACKRGSCEVVPFYLDKSNEFDIDVDKLILSASAGVDMIILCNPNNPTSRITDKAKMLKILDYCQERGIYVLVDEAYADFVGCDISVVKQIKRYANLLIIRTFANYFALGGLRIAYAVSCESLSDLLTINQTPTTVNYFALNSSSIILKDLKYIKRTRSWLQTEPKRFFHMVSTLGGVTAFKPYANYIFIELEQIPSAILCERLQNKGVTVCNCNKMGTLNGQYIRIAIKDRKTNDKFLDKFSRCLL